ncbi:MAG: hypothetical protein D6809_01965, partial [Gammaproteobacteria bacterium]
AEGWQAEELGRLLAWWWAGLAAVRRRQAGAPAGPAGRAQEALVGGLFRELAQRIPARSLHAFMDALALGRLRLEGQANPRLLLEELLLGWRDLLAGSGPAFAAEEGSAWRRPVAGWRARPSST